MRLWHYKLLPYLPDAQFKGQLRELVAIMHDWRDKGQTNHLLINLVMQYPKADLYGYFLEYCAEYLKRNNGQFPKCVGEFLEFGEDTFTERPFKGWHDVRYLRCCMANLYEKHVFGIGRSRITHAEWERLLQGYYDITGQHYQI